MGSWVVGAPIVNHHLVGVPRLSHRLSTRHHARRAARALSGVCGLLFGALLSVLLWIGVIALVS